MLASAVSLIDIAMLGRLGTDALAAVGYTSQFFQLAQAALLALSVACVALMARALGAGEPDRARGAFAASLVLALGSAVAICVVAVGFPRFLLGALNADPAVIESGDAVLPAHARLDAPPRGRRSRSRAPTARRATPPRRS